MGKQALARVHLRSIHQAALTDSVGSEDSGNSTFGRLEQRSKRETTISRLRIMKPAAINEATNGFNGQWGGRQLTRDYCRDALR
jgi:hypothetical protein